MNSDEFTLFVYDNFRTIPTNSFLIRYTKSKNQSCQRIPVFFGTLCIIEGYEYFCSIQKKNPVSPRGSKTCMIIDKICLFQQEKNRKHVLAMEGGRDF